METEELKILEAKLLDVVKLDSGEIGTIVACDGSSEYVDIEINIPEFEVLYDVSKTRIVEILYKSERGN